MPLLAVGAQQKNQLALAFYRQRIYSPYIGDLHSLPMQEHFEQTLATFRELYDPSQNCWSRIATRAISAISGPKAIARIRVQPISRCSTITPTCWGDGRA